MHSLSSPSRLESIEHFKALLNAAGQALAAYEPDWREASCQLLNISTWLSRAPLYECDVYEARYQLGKVVTHLRLKQASFACYCLKHFARFVLANANDPEQF